MASTMIPHVLIYALLGGILPPLLWLWFWLREDRKHPEPKGMIVLTFISGMIAVPIAIFFERLTLHAFPNFMGSMLGKIVVWAAIEESLKFLAVALGAFRTSYFDEPIDAVIYMITAALGFAALENVLFLYGILHGSGFLQFFTTGNSRFLGAVILHAVSSSFVGIAIGYEFYKKKIFRVPAILIGLILAITLHSAFNFFIMKGEGNNMMQVFFALWMVAIIAMIIFEKVKKIHPLKSEER